MYVSLTTSPSRLNRIVETNLRHLLEQTHPVDRILLTVPLTNMRGDVWEESLPAFLDQEPFKDRVQVVRPQKDLGPIMKYLGVMHAKDVPDNSWVWVCDDDQLYKTDRIAECWKDNTERDPTVVVATRGSYQFLAPTVKGYSGVLLHKQVIEKVFEHVTLHGLPKCCERIDDNYVSLLIKKFGLKVKMPKRPKADLFESGDELKERDDSLHASHNRVFAQLRCAMKVDKTFQLLIAILSVGVLLVVSILVMGLMLR